MRNSAQLSRMTDQHYSERVRDYSDEELRTELLRNHPSWGASQIVRHEIDRRREARSARKARIIIGLGVIGILVTIVSMVLDH